VRELYPKLAAYLSWDRANRDRDGAGLLEWEIREFEHCRSGESGCDNSPRFDQDRLLDAPDFNAYLANDLDCLARLAPLAGCGEDTPRWQDAADTLRGLINRRLWDAADGFYFDLDPATGAHRKVWASSGFMPLICGAPDPAMAERLVSHLRDGGRFDTVLPVASVSPHDAAYSQDMWRGPSWANHSWLIAEGLDRYGYHAEAQRIRDRWCEVLVRDHGRYGTLFEYYDCEDTIRPVDLLRKGSNKPEFPHQAIRDYGWTATLFVDWCHRSVVGIGG
jgi:neutral trehalase